MALKDRVPEPVLAAVGRVLDAIDQYAGPVLSVLQSVQTVFYALLVAVVSAFLAGVGAHLAGYEPPVSAVTIGEATIPLDGVTIPIVEATVYFNVPVSIVVFPVVTVTTYLAIRWWLTPDDEDDQETDSDDEITDTDETTDIDEPTIIDRVLIHAGLAQLVRTSPRPLAVVAGIAVAALVSLVVYRSTLAAPLLGEGTVPSIAAFLFVFVLVTPLGYELLRRSNKRSEGSTLVLVGAGKRSADDDREIEIGNVSDRPIDLAHAKIEDSEGRSYRLTVAIVVDPGETETFAVPPEFIIEPADTTIDLPFGLQYGNEKSTPTLYTWDGTTFNFLVTQTSDGDSWRDDSWRETALDALHTDTIEGGDGIDDPAAVRSKPQ